MWQRRARLLILLFGLAFAIVVILAIRRRDERAAAAPSPATPADSAAVFESTGAVVQQFKATRHDFRIEGTRQLGFADGRTRFLEGVKVSIDNRAGRTFTISARQADVSPDQSHVSLKEGVTLVSSDGITVRTEDASYAKHEGLVRVDGPASFQTGRFNGRGVGMTYDEARDVIWILKDAFVEGRGEQGSEPLTVTSGAAGLARRDHYLKFVGMVSGDTPSRSMSADEATVYLSEDNKHVQLIELRGQAIVAATKTARGGFRTMQSQDMNLTYGGEGRGLERAVLVGSASIELAADSGRPPRSLSADSIDLGLAPDDGTVTALTARGHIRLDLVGDGTTPGRTIRSASLEATSTGRTGLDSARFREGVNFRETPPGSARSREVTAPALDVGFEPGLGAIVDAHFIGTTRLDDGDLHGEAPDVRYDVANETVVLAAAADGRAPVPYVVDPAIRVDAPRIEVALGPRRIAAEGAVKVILKASADRKGESDRVRRPRMMKADQDVNATAGTLLAASGSRRAIFTGVPAKLWQGETAIYAGRIELDERTGDLIATGGVRSTMVLEQKDEKSGDTKRVTSLASAEELRYVDATRQAIYRTAARVTGPQGDLRAARVILTLAEAGDRLERADADGEVRLQDGERAAAGDRLTYFAGDEHYEMRGDRVIVSEREKTPGECAETTGRFLTFSKATGTIEIGGEGTRAVTKSGKCSSPPW